MENLGDQDKQNYGDYERFEKEVAKRCKSPFDHGDTASLSGSNTQYMPYKKFFGHFHGTKEQFYHSSDSSIWHTKSLDSSAENVPLPSELPEAVVMKKKLKKLDEVNVDKSGVCSFIKTSGLTGTLRFLVRDNAGKKCTDRLVSLLKTLKQQSQNGFIVRELEDIVFILDYLIDMRGRDPILESICDDIMLNLKKPIMMERASDINVHLDKIQLFFMWLGYALAYISDDNLHGIVAESLCHHFTGKWNAVEGSVKSNYCLAAGALVVLTTTTKMISLASRGKLPRFLKIALTIARKSKAIGLEMMNQHVLEYLFYRLNPNFPYDLNFSYINPKNPQDPELKLDFSHDNMSKALSLMLTVLEQASESLDINPEFQFPCPNQEAQRIFIWVFRYECRARDHKHQRKMLLGAVMGLLRVYGNKLATISCDLMLDILSLSVQTEVPATGWLADVHFNTSRIDVEFKKLLIKCSVKFLQIFPFNRCFVTERQWMLGMVYLLDPQLYSLRRPWTAAAHEELSALAMQALICALPICQPGFAAQLHITNKILWFIESYENEVYSMDLRYWSLRLLRVCTQCETQEGTPHKSLAENGSRVLINAIKMLLNEADVLMEREQVILAICCCMLTDYNAEQVEERYSLLSSLLNMVLRITLKQNGNISDRLLISLLDAIWEIIVCNPALRKLYVSDMGVYKLLDICSRNRYAIQCICLGFLCDILRDGLGVAQIVTWRAPAGALVVPKGAHVAELLAACCRAECNRKGIGIDDTTNAIKNLEFPLESFKTEYVYQRLYEKELKHFKTSKVTLTIPGSRISKASAILQMLSLDLGQKVDIADETYKLYMNIELQLKDECILILCYHYLTCKIDEAWQEGYKLLARTGMPYQKDLRTLSEFTKLSRNWGKEIRRLQDDAIAENTKKLEKEEASLYELLRRCRLGIALRALQEVRCQARSSDRTVLNRERLADAVHAVNRRRLAADALDIDLTPTFVAPIDDKNKTGQFMIIKDSGTGKFKSPPRKYHEVTPATPGQNLKF